VLSVLAAAADGAGRLASDDLVLTARAAASAAAEALARTPQQLPALARAGVVDAGGRGLVLLLEALVEALDIRAPAPQPEPHNPAAEGRAAAVRSTGGDPAVGGRSAGGNPLDGGRSVGGDRADLGQSGGDESDSPGRFDGSGLMTAVLSTGSGEVDFGYEVQYLLAAPASAVGQLRTTLDGLGESLVVVGAGGGGADEVWNVHVHVEVAQIGPAIEAGVVAGRPYRISVTTLEGRTHGVPPATDRAAVVVADGAGLTALFAAEGATVVGRNPSTAEILAAVAATGAGHVVLLPNDAAAHAVAGSAAREAAAAGLRVSVVPTRSPVQALAALAVRDEQRAFDEDVIAMAEAAGACRYGEVCVAGRAAFTVAGRCEPGDLLGLVDGEVLVIGDDVGLLCRRLLDRMLGGGGELVTLVLGAAAAPGLAEALRAHMSQTWPFVELHCYAGGQPRYLLLVGVE
jgi:dihydroxyacetone kinase-like predicted kinase